VRLPQARRRIGAASLSIIDNCHRSDGSSAARALLRVAGPIFRTDRYLSLHARMYIQIPRTIDDDILDLSSRVRGALPPFRRKTCATHHDHAQSCAIYRIESVRALLRPFEGDEFLAQKVRSSCFRFKLRSLKASLPSRLLQLPS
jgi:hypothetical protein